uniref:F-box only protein 47 n=1 Tax=Lethenteron camtschaticum TaxID=980415 RepID=A0A646RR29_LETCA|nr:F-box only protein 47 [Lethenteron camtschaticum]
MEGVKRTNAVNKVSCALNGDCRKSRSSSRLQEKKNALAEAHLGPQFGPIGTLCILPTEMLHKVFSYLEATQLSLLCLVSRDMCQEILEYMVIPSTCNRLLFDMFHLGTEPSSSVKVFDHDRTLGMLLKRATLLKPTKERLKILHNFTCMVQNSPKQIRCFKYGECANSLTCSGFVRFGKLLQTLIAGWEEMECHRVFKYVSDRMHLDYKMTAILSFQPGKAKQLEMEVKCVCRRVLLDPCLFHSERLFWLGQILKPWPLVSQARLLFVIYGPYCEHEGRVLWERTLVKNPARDTSLRDLGSVVRNLGASNATNWNDSDVMSIIGEISVLPNKWNAENFARFLILCGERVCTMMLSSRAVNRHFPQLANLVVFMSVVCEKDGYKMAWLANTVKKICCTIDNQSDVQQLLHSIVRIYKEVIVQLIHSLTDIPHQELELNSVINAQGCFLREIMCLAFSPVLVTLTLQAPQEI